MEIGNQIRKLRLSRGITQEEVAQHFGITPQAVSKWERGAATPDISMLPDLSAYFGVTIDVLFAVSDETRMERIRNMLWDVRCLSHEDMENTRTFLLEKARREPDNGEPHTLLADMENNVAKYHHDMAAEYAKEALRRSPTCKDAHCALTQAMNGECGDWYANNHAELIEYYKAFVSAHPEYVSGYLWLLDQLIADDRLEEARHYCDRMAQVDRSFRTPLYNGLIALRSGEKEKALQMILDLEKKYPAEAWVVCLSIGDVMARTGNFEQAKAYYRKALESQESPRYTDGPASIAQICEIQGDYAGAIAALREEISVLNCDWNITCGETVDQITRDITRLEKQLQK